MRCICIQFGCPWSISPNYLYALWRGTQAETPVSSRKFLVISDSMFLFRVYPRLNTFHPKESPPLAKVLRKPRKEPQRLKRPHDNCRQPPTITKIQNLSGFGS